MSSKIAQNSRTMQLCPARPPLDREMADVHYHPTLHVLRHVLGPDTRGGKQVDGQQGSPYKHGVHEDVKHDAIRSRSLRLRECFCPLPTPS